MTIYPCTYSKAKRFSLWYLAYALCISSVAFAILPCAAQTRGSMINKHDLASAGVSIITPTEPGFTAELDKLGLGTNPDAGAVRSFSAILQNSSKRSVVAFAVNWTITDIQGNTFSHAFNYAQPSALLDGGKAKREKALVE